MGQSEVALRPSYWASVSGGKDSLMMLMLILQHLDEYPLDGVVHYELETDFPFIKEVIGEMKKGCDKAGIPFIVFKPKRTWQSLYDEYGYPNRRKRWCNDKYKLSAEADLKEFLLSQGKYLVKYIGFCADEVNRFRFDLNDRGQKVTQIYPLAEKGMNEKDIWLWAKENPIFNDYYKYNFRCGCMCCPLASRRGLAYTKVFYPEQYEHYMNLSLKTEKEMGFTTFDGKPKYTTEYIMNRVDRLIPLKELEEWK